MSADTKDMLRRARLDAIRATAPPKPKAGTLAARFAYSIIKAGGPGHLRTAAAHAEGRSDWYGDAIHVKEAVTALVTGEDTAPVLADVHSDFANFSWPLSVLGRLDSVRRVPFRAAMLREPTAAPATWVGEGGTKPIAQLAIAGEAGLEPRKVVKTVVLSQELARHSRVDRDALLGGLAKACAAGLDVALLDGQDGDSDRPPSILFGVTPTGSSGLYTRDLETLAAGYSGSWETAALIMRPETALAIALRGGLETLGVRGGSVAGVPVVTSEAVPIDSSGSTIVLVDQDRLSVAGGTEARLDVAEHASVQLIDDPQSTADATAELVSLWQRNLIALRAELFANWHFATAEGAVVAVDNVAYTTES